MPTKKKLLGKTTAPVDEVILVMEGEHADPFHVLGAHPIEVEGQPAIALRAFLPQAAEVWAIRHSTGAPAIPLERIHADGFFEAVLRGESQTFPYRLRVKTPVGIEYEFDDPYRFPPVLSDFDLHLMGEGTHYKKYEKLGAHLTELEGVRGVMFGDWAPNARRVSVVGGFNQWDGRRHPMRIRGSTGIWELFIPGLGEGEVYKYEIKSNPSGSI